MSVPRLLFLFALGGALCCLGQAADTPPAIPAVAALSDPAKISTLKTERAANARLLKILAWLEEARRSGIVPSKIIDEAQKLNGDQPPHSTLVKEMLLRNFEYAGRASLLNDDNLTRMKSGRSPIVPAGTSTYAGERYEVDHIIPLAEFPQFGNDLINLILVPQTVNRRKSDEIKQRALDLGRKLTDANLLSPEDYEKLKKLTREGKQERRQSIKE